MTYVSVIAVFDPENQVLLCERQKNPYKGLYDLVGGKREAGEDGLACAYRELFEETGITKEDISLRHLMNIEYCISDITVQVFFGKLQRPVALVEEVNPLFWSGLEHDFSDTSKYSGSGYLSHVFSEIEKIAK